jgi:lipoyl(octanoyl) transferase
MKIKYLGRQDFLVTWQAMYDFTQNRNEHTENELWVLEHLAVFTQGQAGKPEHILNAHDIPVIQTDRGGQVTYHGPGQLIVYVLFDLKRAKMNVRQLVTHLEQAIIRFLAMQHIQAHSDCTRPGVYIGEEKIASIGLRVKKGCSFHGISFNVDMDLTPFSYINPCGYAQLRMTQLKSFLSEVKMTNIQADLAQQIEKQLHSQGHTEIISHQHSSCGDSSDS